MTYLMVVQTFYSILSTAQYIATQAMQQEIGLTTLLLYQVKCCNHLPNAKYKNSKIITCATSTPTLKLSKATKN